MKHFSVKVEKINDSCDDSLFFPLDSLKIKMKLGPAELEISQKFFRKLKKFTEKSSIFFSRVSSLYQSDRVYAFFCISKSSFFERNVSEIKCGIDFFFNAQ